MVDAAIRRRPPDSAVVGVAGWEITARSRDARGPGADGRAPGATGRIASPRTRCRGTAPLIGAQCPPGIPSILLAAGRELRS